MNIDVAIFFSFLVLNLIVGLNYGRKVKDIKDFALGGRNFSTGVLVATVVATWISGSGFFITVQNTYSDGLIDVIFVLCMVGAFLIDAFIMIPRMGEFLGSTSIAEAIGGIYDNRVRFITALTGSIGAAGMIAVQFKAFGNIFQYFLELPGEWAIVASGTIVTIYSAFGGIRSVTFTDVLQFTIFAMAIPLVGILIWNSISANPDFSLPEAFENPKFDIKQVVSLGNPNFVEAIPLMLYFLLPGMMPTMFQRVSVGRTIEQSRKVFLISAAIVLLVQLFIAWIPFLIFCINPDLEPQSLVPHIMENYSFTGLKGLIIVAVVAMAMSTADAYVNTSSVLFSHDICSVLKLSPKNELLLARLFSLSVGIFAIFLAMYSDNLMKIILFANSFYMPIATVSFTLAVLGFRSNPTSVLIGMGAGFATVVIWKIMAIEMDCISIAMGVNLVFFMGSHYLMKAPGGWVGIKDRRFLDEAKKARAERRREFIESVKNFNLIEFFKKTAPKNELTYTGLGVFCIFYTLSVMYSTQVELSHGWTVLICYQIMLCLALLFTLYPLWPASLKYETAVQAAWHFVIFLLLDFFSVFFVMVGGFTHLLFSFFTINMILTIILAGWKRGCFMILTGFYSGIKFYEYYSGKAWLDPSLSSPEYILMYVLGIVGASIVIFLKPKEDEYIRSEGKVGHLTQMLKIVGDPLEKAKAVRTEFIRNIQHELNNPLTGITSMADTLKSCYDKLNEKDRKDAIDTIFTSSVRLETFAGNLINLSKFVNDKVEPHMVAVHLSALLRERIKTCKTLYEATKEQEFVQDIENNIFIEGDYGYLSCALDNLILNAISYCKRGKITLKLHKPKEQKIILSIEDEGLGIPPEELSTIFDSFEVSSKTRTPAGGRGIGLSVTKSVIELHKGSIKAESGKDGKGAKFTIIL